MIVSSSPTKIILCGEHYVVYGAKAVALPVDKRNSIELEVVGREGKLILESSIGKAVIYNTGEFEGEKILEFCKPVYLEFAENSKETFSARVSFGGAPKGMGNSASIASALGMAFSRYFNRKISTEKLFEITQVAENIAHGGKASGIDARTVITGKAQLFRKTFNPVKFHFKNMKLELPKNTTLIAVSTYKNKRETTGQLVERFAVANGIKKKPDELTDAERSRLISEYEIIFNGILEELKVTGNAKRLGGLFNRNHELLRNSNVSTKDIDEAIRLAIASGAHGGKLTGAGGSGGACFVLANVKDVREIMNRLNANGYFSFIANLAMEGTGVDKS